MADGEPPLKNPEEDPELSGLLSELVSDIGVASEAYKASRQSQYARRTYFRSAFAGVEGIIAVLKRFALIDSRRSQRPFSAVELAALDERTFEVNDKGEVASTPKNIKLRSNVRFAVHALLKANPEITFRPDYGSDGWRRFSNAASVRDRLTHPKCLADLHVSDEDAADLKAGLTWLLDATRMVLGGTVGERIRAVEENRRPPEEAVAEPGER